MANKRRFTITKMRQAIIESRGIKSKIAETLDCSRQTVDNYLSKYPELQQEFNHARETLIDKAEVKLAAAVDAGNLGAVMFTLETLGKNRGWTKRTEITGADGENVLKLPPEIMDMLRVLGVSTADLIRELGAQMAAMAAMAQAGGAG